ncbi:smoothelin-like protein 1 isoform X1 [Drosophila eugracilis]|uniref:smoothelin-like protein 1 isoform X1 n=1 Tax=Drosophila eugracilis TaxID=29029 RepID=UPI001BD9F48F|nr:smoothelin-like protein 1 isoform X1 [Drosophila eugracilis]
MGSISKELINQMKVIQSDFKNDTPPGEATGDSSGKDVLQMKNCLGKLVALTRTMRELYVESNEMSDKVKSINGMILSRCNLHIKRLSSLLGYFDFDGNLNIANQSIFKIGVDSVLFVLDSVINESSIKSSTSETALKKASQIVKEPTLNESQLKELKDLRLKLKNSEKCWDLEKLGHNLMLSRERTLALQARKTQRAVEKQLVKEQQRAKELEESLSKYKNMLKIVTEQNQELKEKSKDTSEVTDQSQPKESSVQRWSVEQRKCKIPSRGKSLVKTPLKLNQSQQEALKNLKHRLKQEKKIMGKAKTAISQLKKDIDELSFRKGKQRIVIQKERNSKKKLGKNRNHPLNVIDDVLKSLDLYNNFKNPESNAKWSQLMESLQGNLLMIRKRWQETCPEGGPESKTNSVKPTSRSTKIEELRFKPCPRYRPQSQSSQDLLDKIYKPSCPSTPVPSRTRLARVVSKERAKPVNFGVSSLPLQTGSKTSSIVSNAPQYLGKTFGNRRLDLLRWCKLRVMPYGIPMYEFSASWRSGRALCAIIHSYRPHLIDNKYLQKKGSKETLTYGFGVAQSLGIPGSTDLIAECQKSQS